MLSLDVEHKLDKITLTKGTLETIIILCTDSREKGSSVCVHAVDVMPCNAIEINVYDNL